MNCYPISAIILVGIGFLAVVIFTARWFIIPTLCWWIIIIVIRYLIITVRTISSLIILPLSTDEVYSTSVVVSILITPGSPVVLVTLTTLRTPVVTSIYVTTSVRQTHYNHTNTLNKQVWYISTGTTLVSCYILATSNVWLGRITSGDHE